MWQTFMSSACNCARHVFLFRWHKHWRKLRGKRHKRNRWELFEREAGKASPGKNTRTARGKKSVKNGRKRRRKADRLISSVGCSQGCFCFPCATDLQQYRLSVLARTHTPHTHTRAHTHTYTQTTPTPTHRSTNTKWKLLNRTRQNSVHISSKIASFLSNQETNI